MYKCVIRAYSCLHSNSTHTDNNVIRISDAIIMDEFKWITNRGSSEHLMQVQDSWIHISLPSSAGHPTCMPGVYSCLHFCRRH